MGRGAVDWAGWGAAVMELSLVADDDVVVPAEEISDILVSMERYLHRGERDAEQWRGLQASLADAQVRFVNAARGSLSRFRQPLTTRLGGPLIVEQ